MSYLTDLLANLPADRDACWPWQDVKNLTEDQSEPPETEAAETLFVNNLTEDQLLPATESDRADVVKELASQSGPDPVDETPEFPVGPFACVVIDPPWPMRPGYLRPDGRPHTSHRGASARPQSPPRQPRPPTPTPTGLSTRQWSGLCRRDLSSITSVGTRRASTRAIWSP
jgi:hypothetical protein